MKHNARPLVFNDFSGGINVMSEGDLIAMNEMQECQNFYFLGYQRSLTARGGLSKPLVTFSVEILGTYYDIDSNTFLVFLRDGSIYHVPTLHVQPIKVGKLTGDRRPICTKFQNRIWIASGDKLQSYNFAEENSVQTAPNAPVCDIVFDRGARLCAARTGTDRILLSTVGDGETWNTDDNDASTGAWIDVGYGDSADIIAVVPLATDLLIIKNNGMIYQLTGDKEVSSWMIYRIATQTDAVGRNCAEAVGNDVVFVSRQGMKTMSTTMDYGNIAQGDLGEKWNALVTSGLYEPSLFQLRRRKLLFIQPKEKGGALIAYNYAVRAATTLKFPVPITAVNETMDRLVVAAGKHLYEMDEENLKDGDTPIEFRLRTKDLISTEKILVRSVDSSMAATQAGDVNVEIDNVRLKMPSNTRRKVRCNHSSPRIQTTVSATMPFQIKHLILEVADL
nr:MAG TPA: stabilization protein [Caudoviricetes sp.]